MAVNDIKGYKKETMDKQVILMGHGLGGTTVLNTA